LLLRGRELGRARPPHRAVVSIVAAWPVHGVPRWSRMARRRRRSSRGGPPLDRSPAETTIVPRAG
jgi:hypothetical protein